MAMKNYQPGEVVCFEGEKDKRVFSLRNGILEVLKGDVVHDEIHEPGTIFGEMSYLLNGKRTTTIRAKTECKIHIYDISLDEIISKYPNVAKKIMITLAKRIEKSRNIASQIF